MPADFSQPVKDRTKELEWWPERVEKWLARGTKAYAFANNRYQGYARASVALLLERLNRLRQD